MVFLWIPGVARLIKFGIKKGRVEIVRFNAASFFLAKIILPVSDGRPAFF
jgi:hypothetical protein